MLSITLLVGVAVIAVVAIALLLWAALSASPEISWEETTEMVESVKPAPVPVPVKAPVSVQELSKPRQPAATREWKPGDLSRA